MSDSVACARKCTAEGTFSRTGGLARWVFVDIPLRTVLPEELLFRGALDTFATKAWGPRWSMAVGATAFGLWHWRVSNRSVPVVLFTGASGVLFIELRRRTGTILAPMALHWVANASGAVVNTAWKGWRGAE